MSPYFLGQIVGAVIITFLLSRLILLMMRSWDGGYWRLVLVHLFTWVTSALIAGIGMADGGPFMGAYAAMIYGPAVLFWLFVDATWLAIRRKRNPA
mgnify:CR=1 FL=1